MSKSVEEMKECGFVAYQKARKCRAFAKIMKDREEQAVEIAFANGVEKTLEAIFGYQTIDEFARRAGL